MQDFENFLLNNLPKSKSIHPHYEDALQKMLIAGGKRFRPMLLLCIVSSFNPLLVNSAMSVALSIELLHTYSLIHDDLPSMDNSYLRRGEPTLHIEFDETTAILVGDALNTYAFELLSNSPFSDHTKILLIRELSSSGGLNGMVLGQAMDCYYENKSLDIEDVKFLHIHKTAKLIASSLKMGAIIIGNESLGDRLYDFGIKLGLLFQIQDDILDSTQNSKEAGKPTHNDEHKNSFVTILGVEKAIKEADNLSSKISKEIDLFEDKLQQALRQALCEYINRHKQI